MTDTTTTWAAPPLGPPPTPSPRGRTGRPRRGTGSRRTAVLGAVVAAAVLLAGTAAWFLLLRPAPEVPTGPVARATAAPGAGPAPTTAPVPPPPPLDANLGRDPFRALVVPPAPAATAAPGTGAATTTAAGTAPAPSGGTVATPAPTSRPSLTVTGVAPDDSSATVTVSGKPYTVKPGDVFATSFKVLRLYGGNCGTFQFGSQTVDLCKGGTWNT